MSGGNWELIQQMHNQMSQNGGKAEIQLQMSEKGSINAMHKWMHQTGSMHAAKLNPGKADAHIDVVAKMESLNQNQSGGAGSSMGGSRKIFSKATP